MYKVITEIVLTQQPASDFPDRNKVLNFDFVNSFEISSTWEDLTDTATITFPKNIRVRDEYDSSYQLYGTNKSIGGMSQTPPLFLKGDKITITAGYEYYDGKGVLWQEKTQLFEGYVSKVTSKKPVVLECEDNMWLLKQLPLPNGPCQKDTTLQDIFSNLLAGTPLTVSYMDELKMTFNTGSLTFENDTAASVLEKIQKDYHIHSYFRGDELRIGIPVYYEGEAEAHTFTFQQNIISDDIEYRRMDDFKIGVTVTNMTDDKDTSAGTTKDGKQKTRKKRLEVFVGDQGGDTRTLIYPGQDGTLQQLTDYGNAELKKVHYDGLYGKFTTFGIPYVKHGDNITLADPLLADRNGTYKIKKVTYKGGISGLRQEMTLHYRID